MSREKEILKIIENNPMISQIELSEKLGITRSSASVHITNLMKKGFIKGRGYIVDKKEYACVIGGANNDLQGFPNGVFMPRDSNPGEIKMSAGGVGRNISENLARMGCRTKLITAIGDDLYGNKIRQEAESTNIDMSDTFVIKGQNTSTYMSILDHEGDMIAAISQMDIYNHLTVDMMKTKKSVIENSRVCVLDTNLREDVLAYILNNCRNVDYFVDTVSTAKAIKIKKNIGRFHTLKLNKIEAEMLSGLKINGMSDLPKTTKFFLDKGVNQVFITLGKDGVYYSDGKNESHVEQPEIKVVNATGAGDAFTAALVYAYQEGYEISDATKFAMGAAVLALSHENTINPNINIDAINEKMEELKLC